MQKNTVEIRLEDTDTMDNLKWKVENCFKIFYLKGCARERTLFYFYFIVAKIINPYRPFGLYDISQNITP